MYKYQSFNEFSKKNLENHVLYFNKFDQFNDPFDCWCIENNGIPDPDMERERFLAVIKTWGFSVDKERDALEYYHDYLPELGDLPGCVDQIKAQARISCFSAEADNFLMWSHYADGLRGFCIEWDETVFNCSDDDQTHVDIHHVKYRTSPPQIDSIAYSVANDMFWHNEDVNEALDALFELRGRILATKPFPRAYESEIRAVVFADADQGGIEVPYSPEFIKRIIVGELAAEEDFDFIRKFAARVDAKVPIEVAYKKDNAYGVQIKHPKVLGV